MEKDRKRALRRWKSRNKWHSRIRVVYAYDVLIRDSVWGNLASWKEVLDIKIGKIFKNTSLCCTCRYCCRWGERKRYKRVDFIRETKRTIKEDLYD